MVPAGKNTYPFVIQLSTKLPTSFEGTYGYIRYNITLHIEKPGEKLDPLKETFTIIRPLNLNNQTLFRVSYFLTSTILSIEQNVLISDANGK